MAAFVDCVQDGDERNKQNADYIDDVFKKAKYISSIALAARFQAQEADLRSKYAMAYAERALSEANSAHQVAESLARTSRMVASLSLEFINEAELSMDRGLGSISFDESGLLLNSSSENSREISPNPQNKKRESSVGVGAGDRESIFSYNLSPISPRPDKLDDELQIQDVESRPLSSSKSSNHSLPTVSDNGYLGDQETVHVPIQWTEKDNLIDLQRKLRSLELQAYGKLEAIQRKVQTNIQAKDGDRDTVAKQTENVCQNCKGKLQ